MNENQTPKILKDAVERELYQRAIGTLDNLVSYLEGRVGGKVTYTLVSRDSQIYSPDEKTFEEDVIFTFALEGNNKTVWINCISWVDRMGGREPRIACWCVYTNGKTLLFWNKDFPNGAPEIAALLENDDFTLDLKPISSREVIVEVEERKKATFTFGDW